MTVDPRRWHRCAKPSIGFRWCEPTSTRPAPPRRTPLPEPPQMPIERGYRKMNTVGNRPSPAHITAESNRSAHQTASLALRSGLPSHLAITLRERFLVFCTSRSPNPLLPICHSRPQSEVVASSSPAVPEIHPFGYLRQIHPTSPDAREVSASRNAVDRPLTLPRCAMAESWLPGARPAQRRSRSTRGGRSGAQ
jgi:hypothetical protein